MATAGAAKPKIEKPKAAAAPKAVPKAAPKVAPKVAVKAEKPKAAGDKAQKPKAVEKKAATPVVKTEKKVSAKPVAPKVEKPKAEKPKAPAATKAAPKAAPKAEKPKAPATPKAAKVAKKDPRGKPKTAKKRVQYKRGSTLPKNRAGKQIYLRYSIDVSKPVEDGIMDAAAFEKFLHDRFKVNGKAGVLGNVIKISRDKTKILITSSIAFSKRYIKYLAKKFLKKQSLRDWLRVVATGKDTYELKYYNIDEQAEGDEAEDEEKA